MISIWSDWYQYLILSINKINMFYSDKTFKASTCMIIYLRSITQSTSLPWSRINDSLDYIYWFSLNLFCHNWFYYTYLKNMAGAIQLLRLLCWTERQKQDASCILLWKQTRSADLNFLSTVMFGSLLEDFKDFWKKNQYPSTHKQTLQLWCILHKYINLNV